MASGLTERRFSTLWSLTRILLLLESGQDIVSVACVHMQVAQGANQGEQLALS